MSEKERPKIVVVGSGVIGMSVALQLKAQNDYQITIIARDFASDVESREFSSPWAGANWCSTTLNKKQQLRDEMTFKQWQQWTKQLPESVLAEMPFIEYFHPQGHTKELDEWRSRFLPDYRTRIDSDEEGSIVVEHHGLTLDAPAYLALLEKELRSDASSNLFPLVQSSNNNNNKNSYPNGKSSQTDKGVVFIRATLQRLSDALEHVVDARLIINASGLGSSFLQDVQDKTVYPVLGQTVLIKASQSMQKAPYCAMKVPKNPNFSARNTSSEEYEFIYVIPRAKSATIICGGCAIPDKYSTEVDLELSIRILKRCVEMVPELVDDGIDSSSEEAWKSLTILKHGLGLRPAREDGMRIELEQLSSSSSSSSTRPYHVLHVYGAGGGGYQSGFGVAVEALEKVIDFFNGSARWYS